MDEDKNWVSVQVLGQGETESMICNFQVIWDLVKLNSINFKREEIFEQVWKSGDLEMVLRYQILLYVLFPCSPASWLWVMGCRKGVTSTWEHCVFGKPGFSQGKELEGKDLAKFIYKLNEILEQFGKKIFFRA